jgi:ribonuclease P protein component
MQHLPHGRKLHGSLYTVSVSPFPTRAHATCVVSKKVSPKAVARNTVKRHCREALRPHLKDLPPGAYVFTAKREAAAASFRDVCADIKGLVAKLRNL